MNRKLTMFLLWILIEETEDEEEAFAASQLLTI